MQITDITFQELNTHLGANVFSLSGNNLTLDVNQITGDSYNLLTDSGMIEFAFKLLNACYQCQESLNSNAADGDELTSFGAPFYGTVQQSTPPVMEASISVTGVIPINVDNLVGTN